MRPLNAPSAYPAWWSVHSSNRQPTLSYTHTTTINHNSTYSASIYYRASLAPYHRYPTQIQGEAHLSSPNAQGTNIQRRRPKPAQLFTMPTLGPTTSYCF